jgi:hypothetical protein
MIVGILAGGKCLRLAKETEVGLKGDQPGNFLMLTRNFAGEISQK